MCVNGVAGSDGATDDYHLTLCGTPQITVLASWSAASLLCFTLISVNDLKGASLLCLQLVSVDFKRPKIS